MIVVSDERNIKTIVKCEQCEKQKRGRRMEMFGRFGESRGYYDICFDCIEPKIFWKKKEGGMIYNTPVSFDEK